MSKTAVILFNLGGPDKLESVKPFLFNLFNDPAIISLPNPLRYLVAKLISGKREKTASEIYSHMGGKSPILEETEAQQNRLQQLLGDEFRVFTVMRYWHPRADAVAKQVKEYAPNKIVLLPLYPQYSTTTTASSFKEWEKIAKQAGINCETTKICCYPTDKSFIESHVQVLAKVYDEAKANGNPLVLFSAHGLPEKVIKAGDPYQWQVEQTVAEIVKFFPGMEHITCYQSRVGPLKWIDPYTEEEIEKAAKAGRVIVVVPVAFVSEHSETLVEIGMEYRDLAHENGCKHYYRVPTLSIDSLYISALSELARSAASSNPDNDCGIANKRYCPAKFSKCRNMVSQ